MMNSVSAFIGLRYARASQFNHFIAFINLFSVIGIALGLAALITVSSVMNGFEAQLKQRVLGLVPHLSIATANPEGELMQRLDNSPNISHYNSFVETEAIIQSSKQMQGVMLQGISTYFDNSYDIINQHMLAGSLADLQATDYHIVLGRQLAIKLGLRIGDEVRLMVAAAMRYTPFGPMPSQRKFTLSGVFEVGSELDDKVAIVHISDAARLLRKPVSAVAKTRVFLHDAFDYQSVKNELAAVTDVAIDDWRSRQGPLFDAVKMEKNMMSLMLLLIISVAAFNIVSALVMVVTEKRGDIAILRTQGMSATDIMQIFLINGLYNGGKGALFGLIGGLLLCSQLNNILNLLGMPAMAGLSGLPIDIQWTQVVMMVLLSLLFCFLATIYPAMRAARVAPAQALRCE